jgi:hypothetical protein
MGFDCVGKFVMIFRKMKADSKSKNSAEFEPTAKH